MTSEKHWNTICYVDGFNLYHAIDNLKRPALKGVNLWALAESLLRKRERLASVEYFSAYAKWLPDKYRRHQIYVRALEAAGVTANMAHFKERDVTCRSCGHTWVSREEKETDVRLALKIFEHAVDNMFDRAIIISADSDLVPIVQTIKTRFPEKEVFIAAPPRRYRVARDLIGATGSSLDLTPGRLAKNLFSADALPPAWR